MHIQSERFARSLPVRFTPDELRTKSEEMAEKYARVNALEEEKKQVAADYKARIDSLSSDVATLSRHISQKQEYQQVECIAHLDWPTVGQKTIIRLDTQDVVGVETMGPADRQIVMRFEQETNPNNANPLATPEREELVQQEQEPEAVEQPVDVPVPEESDDEPASMDTGIVEHDTGGISHEASDEPTEEDQIRQKSLLEQLDEAK